MLFNALRRNSGSVSEPVPKEVATTIELFLLVCARYERLSPPTFQVQFFNV